MAQQDKPTKAVCWHGGWQALQILSRGEVHKFHYERPLFEEAACCLPEHIAARSTKKTHPEIISEWFWRTVGPKGLGFVERDDDKGKKRGYRLTPGGLKYVKHHTWEEYEALILEVNQNRSSIYYLEHLSDAGVRRVIDLAVDELVKRGISNSKTSSGTRLP
jgi:hypothetical protein